MVSAHQRNARAAERGMLLIEALVAMAIVAMVTISYIGMRTTALIDATRARNWRLAREIAEERMSELQAGAHELPPESGTIVPIDRYEGFSYKIVLGEGAVAELEAELAEEAAEGDSEAEDRALWQQQTRNLRRAQERGLTAREFEDQQNEDINQRLAEQAPSADEFEECAVVVYFPKLDPDYEGQKETLMIKSRVSTLAISGLTPDQAESLRSAREGSSSSAEANPLQGAGTPAGGDGR
ncbi:MAG TPA: hypothetical protein ENI87_01255 [bacterium]|nr:hypothetical protein [bacterium]